MYYLYAIGTEDMLQPPYDRCYVGVTNNIDLRWKTHSRSLYTVGKFIRNYSLIQHQHMIVLFEGNEEECFDFESAYRPLPMMGLNEAVGGLGGYTSYTEDRSRKISEKHKGKPKPKDQVEKMRNTLIEKGTRKGEKNSQAKKWDLTSPTGMIYTINGNLSETCKRLNLLESALRYNKNTWVPNPNLNGYGGYRAKSKESFEMRMNTIGWCLKETTKVGGV